MIRHQAPAGYADSPESQAWLKDRAGRVKIGDAIEFKYDFEQTATVLDVRRAWHGDEYLVEATYDGHRSRTWIAHGDIFGHVER